MVSGSDLSVPITFVQVICIGSILSRYAIDCRPSCNFLCYDCIEFPASLLQL